MSDRIKPGLDEDKVKEISGNVFNSYLSDVKSLAEDLIDRKMESYRPGIREIELIVPEKPAVNVGIQHKEFEKVLKMIALRIDVFLVGPAGSGKTTLCESIAKALQLPFFMQPVGLQTTKSDLLGYKDANGNYVPSLLREAYENGGVFLMDEIDAGNANVLTVINAMLSNGWAGFPDQMVQRHPDFIFIAAGNTYGRGADRQYVGRNPIDAATLDRFAVVEFDYDQDLELALSGNEAWTKKVQKIREIVFDLKERVIVSPRASIKGSRMLANGFTEKDCLNMLIFKGVNKEIRERIETNLNHYFGE
jgi:MoxR-like ATPase